LDRELHKSIPIMDGLTAAAASGMRARMESLDMLANNLANASAPGFKADREYYSTYLAAEAAQSPGGDIGSVMPVIERQWTDFSQGTLTPTGNPLDIALRGKGFFVATSSVGPLLTRDGSFRMSLQGDLETQEGFKVRGQDGKPIQTDPSKQIEITPEGAVRQEGQVVAQLDVVDIKDTSALSKHGSNYFQCSPALMTPLTDAPMQQGSLESANLQPAESAVRLISVMRQFEMLQRAAAVGSDMSRRALDEVAKATG
jgi:flagellar basal-body rod protein FlgF